MYSKIEKTLESLLLPLSERIQKIDFITAIAAGITMFLPITIVGSLFSLLADFPVTAVSTFFSNIGLEQIFRAITAVTVNAMAVYVAFGVAYRYAVLKKHNGVIAGLMGLGAFLSFVPQSVSAGESVIAAIELKYLGSSGLFIAIITAILVSSLYCKLMNSSKIVIKLPESVPPMVAQSFEPMIVGILVFGSVAVLRFGLTFVTDLNLIDFVNQIIAMPLLKLGSSPYTFMFLSTLSVLLFFIGIHPVSVTAVMTPLLITLIMTAIEQHQAGVPLSNFETIITYASSGIGGTGSTLALLVAMLLVGKSKRYKSLTKITFLPNLLNINEPVIFGLPVVLNPIIFVPFVLSPILHQLISLFFVKIGFITTINPMVLLALPFTFPPFLSHLMIGGWKLLVVAIIRFVVNVILYLPFAKILDKKAVIEENSI